MIKFKPKPNLINKPEILRFLIIYKIRIYSGSFNLMNTIYHILYNTIIVISLFNLQEKEKRQYRRWLDCDHINSFFYNKVTTPELPNLCLMYNLS